jgi:hypothetical protein
MKYARPELSLAPAIAAVENPTIKCICNILDQPPDTGYHSIAAYEVDE